MLPVRSSLLARLMARVRPSRREAEYGLSGDYGSWKDAVAASTGYAGDAILQATRTALWKVKNGEAAFERDSVAFDHPDHSWPLVAGLMWASARARGHLNVLDFGGSLGSTYFQYRTLLAGLESVRWNVVEQPGHVAVGKSDFEDMALRFFDSISACAADTHPGVILLSSVLQYIEKPWDLIGELSATGAAHLIIDRTPFWNGSQDRLCVQTVPPSIYAASYPSWIFSQARFESETSRHWSVVASFGNRDWMAAPVEMTFRGFIMARRGGEA